MKVVSVLLALMVLGMTFGCSQGGSTFPGVTDKGYVRTDAAVGADWVKQVVDGKNPANTSSKKYIILEYQWGPPDENSDYAKGHIPGAIHFNSDDFENGYPTYYLRPDSELQTVLEQNGITTDTVVVVYSSWQIAAARGWWILKYAGVKDVRFLDGGYDAWVKAGGTVETEANAPVPVSNFGATVPVHPEYLATTSYVEVKNAANSPSVVIADVRTYDEYVGESSGYSSLDAKGRIPTAVWAKDADVGDPSAYLNDDGTLKSADEIAAIWNSVGVTKDKEVIFLCGGGWRSALAYLYGYLLGYPNIRNYSSGWFDWSTNFTQNSDGTWSQVLSGRPIKTGP